MQNKMITRVMVALMCGTIAAGSAGVTAFAATQTSGHQNAPIAPYTEYRTVRVAPAEHGKVEVEGVLDGYAACDSKITVKLIPDAGYVADGFTTDSYADYEIEANEDGSFSFNMPWCDEKIGVTIKASFITEAEAREKEAEEAAQADEQAAPADEQTPAEESTQEEYQRILPVNVLPAEHGKVEVSCKEAACGSQIVVKLIPDAGFVAEGFSTGSYADWEIEGGENGVYTFNMPWVDDNGITICATFVAAE